jgi:DNA repair protein RadC
MTSTQIARTLVPARRVRGTAPWVRLVRDHGQSPYAGARVAVTGPRAVWSLLVPSLGTLEVEAFIVLCLDAQHRVVAQVEVSRGTLNASLVHPREVFRVAIALGAASIVLAHNHPSGDPTPSADDRAITTQLVAAGRLLDIPVQDHLIIVADRFTSFAESGLL